MRTHKLKTWPGPFEAVWTGIKRYEIRKDDRGFAVGDVLHLFEWDPTPAYEFGRPKGATGRELSLPVTYMTPGGQWGLPPDVCVLGLGDPLP